MGGVVGGAWPAEEWSKRCPCPDPGTWDYVTVRGTKDFAAVMKNRAIRRASWVISVD